MFGLFKKKETSPIPERRGKRDKLVTFTEALKVVGPGNTMVKSKMAEYLPEKSEWVWFEKRERKHLGIGSYETVPVARFRAYLNHETWSGWGHFETWHSEGGEYVSRGRYGGMLFGNWYITGPVIKEG